ncbi:MAG: beta-lactamase family protein [Erythrobacter sp.]|nr:beta-lactamase family protein [Erythrobacter sp.]
MIRRFLAALVLIAAPAAAQEAAPPPATPPATVVVAFDRTSITPLIVEGLANKETGRKVEANDPVRIASISKLIMALTALRLADEGKLSLTRDVSDYLGWKLRSPYHPDAPVQLTDLLSHRAGLSDKAGYIIPLGESLEAKLADPSAWRETGPPGEAAFEYANLGSPLVATVLEAASGERYDRLVERLVFKPLGVKACLNWIGCGLDLEARAVTLYRHTGEIAADGIDRLLPNCTIPVAEGAACDLESYVPGTNASIFSPQGGVRIGMVDLAKIGQALFDIHHADTEEFVSPASAVFVIWTLSKGATGDETFFCTYGLHFQLIEAPGQVCSDDRLFGDGISRIGHSGEAYGLQSGLWVDPKTDTGFAYFLTEAPPPAGGEDTGGFTPREKALMARALAMTAKKP